jgi:hypothetical protein|nr:tail fiber domain-containing protein [Bacteroidales bacterium]
MGWGSIASGVGGVAVGVKDTASGSYATAVGWNTASKGLASFSSGAETKASGTYSTAMGYQSSSTGLYTTAMGYGSVASNSYAMSMGRYTTASGNNSFAIGYQTAAESFLSLVIGKWNTIGGQSASEWIATDYLLVAGNGGDDGSRSNALTLLKNGNMTVAGDVTANGSLLTSDKRLKENIVDIKYGLYDVLKLRPVSFTWKDKPESTLRLGLVAQEVQTIIGEVVDARNDPEKTLGIRYTDLIPVLIKSIQEQQAIIEEQKKKNDELELQLKLILERLEKLESK